MIPSAGLPVDDAHVERLEYDIMRAVASAEAGECSRDDVGNLARRVQRTRLAARTSDDGPVVSAAVTLHLRGRCFLNLSRLYQDAHWDRHPRARRFFAKFRGLLPRNTRSDLPCYRWLYVRSALAAAERAAELCPRSLECAYLLVSALWALCECAADEERRRRWCVRLVHAAEHGLRGDVGQNHHAECATLYGRHSIRVPTAVERRQVMLDFCRRASQELGSDGIAKCAPANRLIADGADATGDMPRWTPWSSPWRGLDVSALM